MIVVTPHSQIVKLTQMVGELDIQLNTALEENEVLRQRLGVAGEESIDLSELRHKKNMELEQLKKINRDLSQEVLSVCNVTCMHVFM